MLICYDEDGKHVYKAVTAACFKLLGFSGSAAAELVTADEAGIQAVNLRTRGIDKPTDVLSFPMLTGIKAFTKKNYPADYDPGLKAVFLGSILICPQVAAAQAEEYGHSLERETYYLFTHGLLHLLGYDHEQEEDKKIMRKAEEEILAAAFETERARPDTAGGNKGANV